MDEILGTIKLFAGNFAPKYYAFCYGQIIPISSNTALFSLLGTTFGGDGITTFGLPDLRGRVPVGAGNGPGLSPIPAGQKAGEQSVTLNISQIPSHNHMMSVSSADSSQSAATNGASIATPGSLSGRTFTATAGFNMTTPDVPLNGASILPSGQNVPHDNMQPYLGMNYIICTQGVYPSRN